MTLCGLADPSTSYRISPFGNSISVVNSSASSVPINETIDVSLFAVHFVMFESPAANAPSVAIAVVALGTSVVFVACVSTNASFITRPASREITGSANSAIGVWSRFPSRTCASTPSKFSAGWPLIWSVASALPADTVNGPPSAVLFPMDLMTPSETRYSARYSESGFPSVSNELRMYSFTAGGVTRCRPYSMGMFSPSPRALLRSPVNPYVGLDSSPGSTGFFAGSSSLVRM